MPPMLQFFCYSQRNYSERVTRCRTIQLRPTAMNGTQLFSGESSFFYVFWNFAFNKSSVVFRRQACISPISKSTLSSLLLDCWQSVFPSTFSRGYEVSFGLKQNGTRHERGTNSPTSLLGHHHTTLDRATTQHPSKWPSEKKKKSASSLLFYLFQHSYICISFAGAQS